MENFIIQRVGPARGSIFINGHRAVVGEVDVVEHFEHVVSTNGQKGGAHPANFRKFDAAVG